MDILKGAEILRAVGGAICAGSASAVVTGVSTDSRRIRKGELFIPLVGERFDGHDFIADAVSAGAAAFLTHKDIHVPDGALAIRVPDTLKALQDLASFYRGKFGLKVVAVTGSVGKTSTKDIIASVLGQKYRILKSPGNYNNQIGLPLTVLSFDSTYDIAVVEMGMSGFGEIRRLSQIIRPDIAVITNIGISHIEKLGSRQNILKAKLEITDGMPEDGILVLNGDDMMLSGVRENTRCRLKFFGMEDNLDVRAYDITSEGEEGVRFRVKLEDDTYEMRLPVPGVHNVYNALAAVTVGLELGVSPEAIRKGLQLFRPEKMRMNILHLDSGIRLIDDTYNASPQSVEAAVGVLKDLGCGARKIAVLGDMLELGDWSREAHRNVGSAIYDNGIDYLATLGEQARHIADGAVEAGMKPGNICSFHDIDRLNEFLGTFVQKGDVILIKGSRGMKMEQIVQFLKGVRTCRYK